MGGLGRTIMEGMAFGTGSAIAHRAGGAVAGGLFGAAAPAVGATETQAEPAQIAGSKGQDCQPFQRDFIQCVQENKDSIASCQMYMDNYNQCQGDSARLH